MSYTLMDAGLSKEICYMINEKMMQGACAAHVAKLAPMVSELKSHIQAWKQKSIQHETFVMHLTCCLGDANPLLSGECFGMYLTTTPETMRFCGWWGVLHETATNSSNVEWVPFIQSTGFEIFDNLKNSCKNSWILSQSSIEVTTEEETNNACYKTDHGTYCDMDSVRMEMRMVQVLFPRCQWRDSIYTL